MSSLLGNKIIGGGGQYNSYIPTLSIIIPCFNESQTITHIVECVKNVAITYHKEIIIVDDFSTDDTREYPLYYNFKNLLSLT